MTPLGWVFLISSLTFVWGLAIWCFYKVLTLKDRETFEVPPASVGG